MHPPSPVSTSSSLCQKPPESDASRCSAWKWTATCHTRFSAMLCHDSLRRQMCYEFECHILMTDMKNDKLYTCSPRCLEANSRAGIWVMSTRTASRTGRDDSMSSISHQLPHLPSHRHHLPSPRRRFPRTRPTRRCSRIRPHHQALRPHQRHH